MIYEITDFACGNAKLTLYKPQFTNDNAAILILPGGGYHQVCTDREGEPIALAFLSKGFTAFVLEYSVDENAAGHQPMVEASAAMAYIRRNADKYRIRPDRVYAAGFSAGGHLAGSLAVLWHEEEFIKRANIEYGENRPDGVVLSYPVITAGEKAHKGSFYNVLGTTCPTDAQLDLYSLEKHVDEKASPAFIWHTANDCVVPVENSLYLAEQYAKYKIPFELHVYPQGPHGLALANEITFCNNPEMFRPRVSRWVDDAVAFFKEINGGN